MNQAICRPTAPHFRWTRGGVALAASLLLALPMAAHAVDVVAINGTALPGGQATASFTVDFDAGTPTTSFYLTVDSAFELGTLVSSSVTWNNLPLSAPGVPDVFADPALGTFGPDYLAGLGLAAVPINGQLKLSYTYQLAGFADGQSAGVQLYFQYSDDVNGLFPDTTVTSVLTASAVPEPQTWGLALAGVIVMGAWARRRHA